MANRFLDWFLFKDDPIQEVKDEPIIENNAILQNIPPNQILQTKHIFRPIKWEEYIGQDKAKKRLQLRAKGCKEKGQIFPHTLIYGKPGTGKTTLARLLANELNVDMAEVITSSIEHFWKLKSIINKSEGKIIFLDEVHGLNRDTAEKMYPILEDFLYNGKRVPEFTLVAATTELGEIIKKMKPFFDRFKIIIELEQYKTKEMVQIIKQYKQKLFPIENFNDLWYNEIALNCRLIPRNGIRIFEEVLFTKDLKEVLHNLGIIKNGFTQKDLKILQYITNNEKGAGLQSIAAYIDTSTQDYLYQVEPYLLQSGSISRTSRGRKITEKGLALIEELEKTMRG